MLAIVSALVMLAQAATAADSSVVIPAGTRIEAQLDQQLSTRTTSANDSIVMSVSHELLVGSRLALPAGTKIVARLDSITHATGWRTHLDLRMHLVRMIFAGGYSIAFTQPVLGRSSEPEWLHVEQAHRAPEVVAIAAPVVGTAVGAATNGVRGAVTGGAAGMAVGLFVDLIGAVHGHDLVAEKGAPIILVLDAPLALDQVQLIAAADSAAARSPFRPATKPKRCFVAGSPGTPDVTIPGSPPSQGIDGQPANPGTPPTVIPGIPATQDAWVPC
jgi:hypothetical protein